MDQEKKIRFERIKRYHPDIKFPPKDDCKICRGVGTNFDNEEQVVKPCICLYIEEDFDTYTKKEFKKSLKRFKDDIEAYKDRGETHPVVQTGANLVMLLQGLKQGKSLQEVIKEIKKS